ncbi:MAG: hypothetical protein ACLUOI_27500 [Eisenbergiella sp.]
MTKAELSQLKEETFVEVTGFVEPEESASWRGASIDRREDSLAAEAPVPIAVSKWKMGASRSQAGYETSNAEKCEGARKV